MAFCSVQLCPLGLISFDTRASVSAFEAALANSGVALEFVSEELKEDEEAAWFSAPLPATAPCIDAQVVWCAVSQARERGPFSLLLELPTWRTSLLCNMHQPSGPMRSSCCAVSRVGHATCWNTPTEDTVSESVRPSVAFPLPRTSLVRHSCC